MRSDQSEVIENVRILRIFVRVCRLVGAAVRFAIEDPGRAFSLLQTGLSILKQRGFEEFRVGLLQTLFESGVLERGYRPPAEFTPPVEMDPYEAWLEVNKWNDRCLRHLTERLQTTPDALPKISIIVVVSTPSIELLMNMFSSLKSQVYQDWELCVVDHCTTDSGLRLSMAEWASTDRRIKVVFGVSQEGVETTTNDAASQATGDFLAFVKQHDELTPDALGEIALYISQHPETDFVYSDHDIVDFDGRRHSPQFKPDWSPELLLSWNYCDHLVAVRRSLFLRLEGLGTVAESCADYDFVLRATELARHVGHIPLILYHRRNNPKSPTDQARRIDNDHTAVLALRNVFQRRGIRATPSRLQLASDEIGPLYGHEFPDNGPSVGILIIKLDVESDIYTCVQSLVRTTYKNYESFVLDRNGEIISTDTYSCVSATRLHRPVPEDSSVNWAHLMNEAVKQLHTDYVLFLDASLRIAEPRWLSQMMGYAQIENIGTVGARLVSEHGTILNGGVVLKARHGIPDYAFRGIAANDCQYSSYARVARNCSALTRACMVTPRQVFEHVGGFDQEHFPREYYDLDYCLRLWGEGFRTICCPSADLVYGGAGDALTEEDEPEERARFREKYRSCEEHYYSQYCDTSPPIFRVSPRKLVLGQCKPVRALICTHALDLTGAPYYLLDLVVALQKLQVIDCVISSPQDGPLRQDFEKAGLIVHIHDMPTDYTGSPSDYEAAISRFTSYVSTLNCGVVFASTLRSWYAVESARRARVPSIWSIRESEPWQHYYRYLPSEMEEVALNCFTHPYRIIFTADTSRDIWATLDSRHSFMVILDGLDHNVLTDKNDGLSREKARESLNLMPEELAVLLLGTVCTRKGQHDFPRALAKLPARLRGRLRCYIVGDRPGSYSSALRRIVSKLPGDLRDRISIVPETPDTPRYYLAADLFVCTSRVESYPRVILEAMAYSLPIITTPVFGIRQQVKPGFNALFYEPDDPAGLAERLEALIADDALRRQFAANSKHVLNSLIDFDEMVEAYGEVFREAYFSKGRPA